MNRARWFALALSLAACAAVGPSSPPKAVDRAVFGGRIEIVLSRSYFSVGDHIVIRLRGDRDMLVGPPCAALTVVSESGEAFRPDDGNCQTDERTRLGSLLHAGYYGFVNTYSITRPPSDAHIPHEPGRYILLLDVEEAVATATFQLEPNDSPFTAAETARLPRGLTHRYTINPTTLVSIAVRNRPGRQRRPRFRVPRLRPPRG